MDGHAANGTDHALHDVFAVATYVPPPMRDYDCRRMGGSICAGVPRTRSCMAGPKICPSWQGEYACFVDECNRAPVAPVATIALNDTHHLAWDGDVVEYINETHHVEYNALNTSVMTHEEADITFIPGAC